MIQNYPWHKQIWQQLTAGFHENRMPHALLFTGAAGLGKNELAVRLAHFLLCNNPADDACGACVSCKLLAHHSHPDLYILGTEEGMIKIDQIRELIHELTQTAHQGKWRAVIINNAHAMNLAAANALLKTLEEPQAQVVIILLSDHASFLPATIHSRCQNVEFLPPSLTEAKSWLSENIKESANIDLLLRLTENAPLRALALARQMPEREKLLQDIVAFSSGKIALNQIVANSMNYSWEFIFYHLLSLVLDGIKIRQGATQITNQDKPEILSSFKANTEQLFKYCDRLLELNKFIQEKINLNQQLLMENIWLEWLSLTPVNY